MAANGLLRSHSCHHPKIMFSHNTAGEQITGKRGHNDITHPPGQAKSSARELTYLHSSTAVLKYILFFSFVVFKLRKILIVPFFPLKVLWYLS